MELGEHLTLLPSPGKHVIAVNDDQLALELAPTKQYLRPRFWNGLLVTRQSTSETRRARPGQDEITDLVGVSGLS